MKPAVRSGLTAFFLLSFVGLLWPRPEPDIHPDSYGRTGHGQRALFDLLTELGVPVLRWRALPEPAPGPVWWMQPFAWCDAPVEPGEEELARETPALRPQPGPSRAWLEAGGTALVALPVYVPSEAMPWVVDDDREVPICEQLAGIVLPGRSVRQPAPTAAPDTDEQTESEPTAPEAEPTSVVPWAADWLAGELDRERLTDVHPVQVVSGALVPRARELPVRPLMHFDASEDLLRSMGFEVVARLDGEPFALERPVGAGRLVVLADGGFLLNRWLDLGDAAPLAVDLVAAYGTPRFDETLHGYSDTPGTLAYLAGSPAAPVFLGLGLLGGWVWLYGAILPRRRVREHDPAAPALEPFVDSLAALYASTGDHLQVAERYRAVSLARLRRHHGLPADVPAARVLERIGRGRGRSGEDLALLAEPSPRVTRAAELRRTLQRMDDLVEEMCR